MTVVFLIVIYIGGNGGSVSFHYCLQLMNTGYFSVWLLQCGSSNVLIKSVHRFFLEKNAGQEAQTHLSLEGTAKHFSMALAPISLLLTCGVGELHLG